MPPKIAAAAEPRKIGRKPSSMKLNENNSIKNKPNDTNDNGDVEDVGFQILSMSNKNRLINGNGKSKMKENLIDLSFGSSGRDIVSAEDDGSNMKRVT